MAANLVGFAVMALSLVTGGIELVTVRTEREAEPETREVAEESPTAPEQQESGGRGEGPLNGEQSLSVADGTSLYLSLSDESAPPTVCSRILTPPRSFADAPHHLSHGGLRPSSGEEVEEKEENLLLFSPSPAQPTPAQSANIPNHPIPLTSRKWDLLLLLLLFRPRKVVAAE